MLGRRDAGEACSHDHDHVSASIVVLGLGFFWRSKTLNGDLTANYHVVHRATIIL